jgi:hypothetical protein
MTEDSTTSTSAAIRTSIMPDAFETNERLQSLREAHSRIEVAFILDADIMEGSSNRPVFLHCTISYEAGEATPGEDPFDRRISYSTTEFLPPDHDTTEITENILINRLLDRMGL